MSSLLLDLLKAMAPGNWRMVSRGKKGEEWAGPCPVCGGNDRLRAWPSMAGGEVCREAGISGKWWCRQCDQRGDAVSLLEFARGLDFIGACKDLGIGLSTGPRQARQPRPLRQPAHPEAWVPQVWPAPTDKWQGQASKLALEASEYLVGYAEGLQYLAGRGLPLEAVKEYELGYLTGDDKLAKCRFRARSAFGLENKQVGERLKKVLWIPRGLTIPLWVQVPAGGSLVHRLRIRRRTADLVGTQGSKFLLLEGSGQAPMILRPTKKAVDRTVWVIVEAELDAMAVHHACAGKVGVIAVLTNRGKPDAAAHAILKSAPSILVSLDFDDLKQGHRPGGDGWVWWRANYPHAKRFPVPEGKDPGEAFSLGVDLAQWVLHGYPPAKLWADDTTPSAPVAVPTVAPCVYSVASFVSLLEKHQDNVHQCETKCSKTGEMVNMWRICLDCPSAPAGLFETMLG